MGPTPLRRNSACDFQLDGDVIPDAIIPLVLPQLDEAPAPLFALRGIQPFHDFPEGPDWWNADDYKTYCTQMAKLRMNFIGCTVILGSPSGRTFHPSRACGSDCPRTVTGREGSRTVIRPVWANTARSGPACPVAWGCRPAATSNFCFGAAQLFETDAYAARRCAVVALNPRPPSSATNCSTAAEICFATCLPSRGNWASNPAWAWRHHSDPGRVRARLRRLEKIRTMRPRFARSTRAFSSG